MRLKSTIWPGLLLMAAGGCGGMAASGESGVADAATSPQDSQSWEAASCGTQVQEQANGGHLHTANDCDPVSYASIPPSSGTHYPDWAAYKTYTAPVP